MGFHVLRFDFHGLGDSEGLLSESVLADVYSSIQGGRYVRTRWRRWTGWRARGGSAGSSASGLCGGSISGSPHCRGRHPHSVSAGAGNPCHPRRRPATAGTAHDQRPTRDDAAGLPSKGPPPGGVDEVPHGALELRRHVEIVEVEPRRRFVAELRPASSMTTRTRDSPRVLLARRLRPPHHPDLQRCRPPGVRVPGEVRRTEPATPGTVPLTCTRSTRSRTPTTCSRTRRGPTRCSTCRQDAAEADHRIRSVLALGMPVALEGNPDDWGCHLTRGQLEGLRRGYLRKALRPEAWKRFVTGRSSYSVIKRSLFRPPSRTDAAEVGAPPDNTNPRFAPAFFSLVSSGRPIILIFSGADRLGFEFQEKFVERNSQRLEGFCHLFEVHTIENANHVLSDAKWVDQMLTVATQWLDTNHPAR